MALCTVTINNQSPALDKKSSEASVIGRALMTAAHDIMGSQGNQTAGNIVVEQGLVIGSWTVTNQATQP